MRDTNLKRDIQRAAGHSDGGPTNGGSAGKGRAQRPRILAVASPGGRWAELRVLASIFDDADIYFASSQNARELGVDPQRYLKTAHLNLYSLWKLPLCIAQFVRAMIVIRPDVVISTGAAPGLIAIALGRLMGAKSIWVESLISVEELSLSGRFAGLFSDMWLTQWEQLSTPRGPYYKGSLL